MKKLIFILFTFNLALADDRLQNCIDEGKLEISACYADEISFWDKELQQNYQKAEKACNKSPNPKQCLEDLSKIKKITEEYQKAMNDLSDKHISNGSRWAANSLTLQIIKNQIKDLELFIKWSEQ